MTEIDYTAQLKGHLKLSKLGEWWHEGVAFQNKALANLFSRSVVWDPVEKQYFVQIGRQRASFDCEDTAYFVQEIVNTNKPWKIKLSDDSTEELDPTTLRVGAEDQFYCTVKENHLARFSRSAHQVLIGQVIDQETLEIAGERIAIKNHTK